MEKAYDLKALALKLKARGLDIAEDAAKIIVEETMDWTVESALKSENKVDDILAGVMPIAKKHVLELVDKIDGQEG